jgi:hypothetical protein
MFAKTLNETYSATRCSTSAALLLDPELAGTQVPTILEEARHSLIIIEHDPLFYEDAQGMVEYVSQGSHDAAETFLEDMTRNADTVFRFDEGPRATTKLIAEAYAWRKGLNLFIID